VTPAGAVTTFDVAASVYPQGMVAGPDGALWWVGGGLVGRTTTAGVTTLFPDASAPFAGSIAAGADGALWYTDAVAGSVTRLTVGGVRTVVRKGDIGAPDRIVSGPDGALWFTDVQARALRRLTTGGVPALLDVEPAVQSFADLTVGPDDALWFTASAGGGTVVGRVQVLGAPGAPQHLAAVAGTGTATLAWQAGVDGGAAVTGYTVTAAPGGASCTWVSGPLSCVITGLDQATTYTFTARATSVKGQGAPSAPSNPIVPRAGTRFHPVAPTRVLDSRTAVGGWSGPLVDPEDLGLSSAVPATATAVVMNVTVTEPQQPAYLTVWPAGQPRPVASNLNFGTGQTIANLVTVQLGTGQAVSFAASSGSTHVIADLVGWFDDGTVAGDRFNATGPTRALDSRTVTGDWNGSLVAGTPQDLAFPMVPADATAVVVNVTATGSTANSYLTVWPSGAPQPTVSNLNFATGQTIPNLAVVPLGANHKASFATRNGSTDVVVDVTGWFSPNGGDLFHPMPPLRVLDDRFGIGLTGPWGINTTRTLTVTPPVPADATALVANVTATNPTANSFVTVFPSGQSVPTASNLNFGADQTIPNLVMTSIGPGHGIGLHNRSGSVDLVADAVGYYAAT
jgi:sugar lactone lactonase YvrE